MPGIWIKWVKGLTEKPEIIAISEALDLTRFDVAARCMKLWEWADDVSRNGHVPGVTQSFVDAHVGVTGFAKQLEKCCWISFENGDVLFPHYDRHNSKNAKSRALGQERQSRSRHARSVTKPSLEKRREEKSKKENTKEKESDALLDDLAGGIYDEYPRHVGRKAAIAKIKIAIRQLRVRGQEKPASWLLQRVRTFAQSQKGKEKQFIPYPTTWFGQARYDDDPKDWFDSKTGGAATPRHRAAEVEPSPRLFCPPPDATAEAQASA